MSIMDNKAPMWFSAVTESELAHYAENLAQYIDKKSELCPVRLYLSGVIGAGKTTFSRYFLHALGIQQPIKSPTYTLVEHYCTEKLPVMTIVHADLYRLNMPDELYEIDLLEDQSAIWLIEWPEQGGDLLPSPDLHLHFSVQAETYFLSCVIQSEKGQELFNQCFEATA